MAKLLVLVVILAGLHSLALGAPDGRIIGGNKANPGQFPFMVSVQMKLEDTDFFHMCGGSILTNKSILTAAHCVGEGFQFQVYVGSNNLDSNGTAYKVESFVKHPDYIVEIEDEFILQHDIAVVYLNESIQFSGLVQPVQLDSQYMLGDDNVTAIGWGYIEYDEENEHYVLPNELQYLNLRTIDQELCEEMVTESSLIPHFSHVCFLNKAGEGLCGGDSGSPILKNGRQIGVTSWSGKYCAQGVPDGAARISTDINWIKSVTK